MVPVAVALGVAGWTLGAARFGAAPLRPNGAHVAATAAQAPRVDAPPRVDVPSQMPERAVVVASKPFGESFLLAEMFAQVLEAHGMRVTRRPGLGATEIAFNALRTGAIDVYPEYTG
ncbi:MAG TPA: glycine betaine ABC transporter substrate-binding protein, partial [Gemmatimonadales bacterium]|nr:glycine betaine ABC transporter substrate-binding protein [Gemmatimonadales bacterium]